MSLVARANEIQHRAWKLQYYNNLLERQVEAIFHPVSKEVRNNKYRKTPVIYALTIPFPPLL